MGGGPTVSACAYRELVTEVQLIFGGPAVRSLQKLGLLIASLILAYLELPKPRLGILAGQPTLGVIYPTKLPLTLFSG